MCNHSSTTVIDKYHTKKVFALDVLVSKINLCSEMPG